MNRHFIHLLIAKSFLNYNGHNIVLAVAYLRERGPWGLTPRRLIIYLLSFQSRLNGLVMMSIHSDAVDITVIASFTEL